FRQRELAELNSGASNDSLARPRRPIIKTVPIQVSRQRFKVRLWNVEQDYVLRAGRPHAAAAVLLSQICELFQLTGRRSSPEDRKTGVAERVLMLAVNAEMRSVALGDWRRISISRSPQFSSESRFDLVSKARNLLVFDRVVQT